MSDDFFENRMGQRNEEENRDGNSFSADKENFVGQRTQRRERISYSGGTYDKSRYNNGYSKSYGERRNNNYGQRRNADGRNAYPSQRGNSRYGNYEGSGSYQGYNGEGRYNNENENAYNARPYRPKYPNNNRINNSDGYGSQGRNGSYGENSYNKTPYYGESHRSNYGQAPDGARYGNKPSYGGREQRSGFSPNNGQPRGGYGMNGYSPRRNFNSGYNPHAKYSQKKRLEYKEKNIDPNEPLRLNKYLANAGVCSRRDADKFITSGVVSVNGQVVTELGTKVLRSDVVLFHDQQVKMEKKVYVLLNKPKGYVTTSDDPQNRKTVMDLVKNACPERIYPVGRLDRNTTGVLLFTNDGELASKLTHPKFMKKKIYHVYTDKNVTAADIQQIADGITLEDGDIKADAIEYASPTDKKQIGIEIHSGKNRIVRRIFEHLGYHVTKLDRVYFAGLTKKNVKRGDWRYLTEKEVDMLRMGAFE